MKFTKQQILIVLLVLLVGGGWAYWNYLYWPVVKDVKAKKMTLEEKKQEIERLKGIPEELTREERDLEEKRLQLAEVQDMLPKEKEIPSLLRAITSTAKSNGVDLLSFTPQPLKPAEIYDELPIEISVNANYHNLGKFLNEVGRFSRIVVPTVKTINGKEPTKESPYTLSASLTLSAFVYKEIAE